MCSSDLGVTQAGITAYATLPTPVVVGAPTTPPAPTNVRAANGMTSGEILVTWDAQTGVGAATTYRVDVKAMNAKDWAAVTSTTAPFWRMIARGLQPTNE